MAGLLLAPPVTRAAVGHGPAAGRRRDQSARHGAPRRRYMARWPWGVLPLLFYTAFRRYLQAVNIVKPVTFALVSANLVNVAGNWVLMYGHWGAPRMGLAGSGWSTTIARAYMAAVLGGAVLRHERRTRQPAVGASRWRPDLARMRRLLGLGLPAAGQIRLRRRGLRAS